MCQTEKLSMNQLLSEIPKMFIIVATTKLINKAPRMKSS